MKNNIGLKIIINIVIIIILILNSAEGISAGIINAEQDPAGRAEQIQRDNTSGSITEKENSANAPEAKQKLDRIFLDNGAVLSGKIQKVTAGEILFVPEGGKKEVIIIRDKVQRIEFANGDVFDFKDRQVWKEKTVPVRKKDRPLIFDIYPEKKPNKPRSVFWVPLLSFVLPGLDQWWEGQYLSAVFYSGLAVAGISMMSPDADVNDKQPTDRDLTGEERRTFYGAQLYQTVGSLSAFQSFRTAVESHKNSGNGRFSFITVEETTGDVLLAPFKLTYFARPTTFIPLGLLAGVMAFAVSGTEIGGMKGRDYLYVSGLSYNAGTGEEALFRGWLMPFMMDSFQSEFWSNTATAALFAAAHISGDLRYPVMQFLAGWYFGWVTQRRNWTISESVFIHTWWDIIVITATFLVKDDEEDTNIALPLCFLRF